MLQVPTDSFQRLIQRSTPEVSDVRDIFHRHDLACRIAKDLMSPPRETGMLLTGPRRIGKSTFVRHDLLPVLMRAHDVHVVYIDLWSYRSAEPGLAIIHALTMALQAFDGVVMKAARGLGLTNVKLGGLEMNVQQAQSSYSKRTFELLDELLRKAKRRVVVVLDEVQITQHTEHGRNVLVELTRGAANLNIAGGHGVRVLATGSHAHKLAKMKSAKTEAFYDAAVVPLPLLCADFVNWVRDQLPQSLRPDLGLMIRGFEKLLHRPRELKEVCMVLAQTDLYSQSAVDQVFQLLVDERSCDGRADFMARLRALPKLELALARVMSETGPRFAPHMPWCHERVAALMGEAGLDSADAGFTTSDIEAALNGLVASGFIWRGMGFAFEEPRAVAWLMALDPATDFRVEGAGSTAPGSILPAPQRSAAEGLHTR